MSSTINISEINEGRLYPKLDRIREVSVIVAREVIRQAQRQSLDGLDELRDMDDEQVDAYIKRNMYDPRVVDVSSEGSSIEVPSPQVRSKL